jgi:DNA-binding transcriptional LysR family regulator
MLPDLVSLSLFLRAVDARSLSKAAEQSHLALAAASRRIALLEHCYGVQLLYRSSQGVEPTPAGISLAFHARQLLQQEEMARAELSDFAKGIRGHIRIHPVPPGRPGGLCRRVPGRPPRTRGEPQ